MQSCFFYDTISSHGGDSILYIVVTVQVATLLFYNPNRNSFLKLRRILRSLQKLVCSLGEQRTALKQVTGCLI